MLARNIVRRVNLSHFPSYYLLAYPATETTQSIPEGGNERLERRLTSPGTSLAWVEPAGKWLAPWEYLYSTHDG